MRQLGRFRLVTKRRLALAILAVITAAIVALSLAETVWSDAGPSPLPFTGASASTLAADGVTLTPPQSAAPMAAATASGLAAQVGHKPVLQEQYAHCVVTSAVPPVDEDCWAVSLDPTGLASTTGDPATYYIVLIDPNTGKVLLSGWGSPGPTQ